MRRIRLRETRRARGLTVRALADKAGIDHSTLSKIESGARGLSVPMAEKLAEAMETTAAELLGISPAEGTAAGASFREDAEPYVFDDAAIDIPIAIRRAVRDTITTFRLKTNALSELGYKAGGIVFVDIGESAVSSLKQGQCVIAQRYADMTATTIARQFIEPSLLITNSRDNNEMPLNLESDDVVVKGVIVGLYTPHH
jgi:transcriptional regulator with XRE-family HTH domain